MNFAIFGVGNTGKANCAFLSSLGHQVVLYDRKASHLEPIASLGLTATGMVTGTFTPRVKCGWAKHCIFRRMHSIFIQSIGESRCSVLFGITAK